MGRLMLLTIPFFGLGFAARGIAEDRVDNHPNFSGHWILNLDKSKFGKMPKPMGMTLVATTSGDTMHAVTNHGFAGWSRHNGIQLDR